MEILVTGGGPSGVATAIGLARCGFRVVLLTGAKRRPWLEGLSLRTGQALAEAGCQDAAALAGEAPAQVRRHVAWGALRSEVNRESLVDRAAFDAALQRDAAHEAVEVIEDSLLRAEPSTPDRRSGHGDHSDHRGWTARTRSGRLLHPRYWVDARGRSAPRGRQRVRGVPTLALAIPCVLHGGPALASALIAGERGYFWVVARSEDALVQWFRDPPENGAATLASEIDAEVAWLRRMPGPGWLSGLARGDTTPSQSSGRDATAFLVDRPIGPTHIRVGDAAAATDPLSGQGVWSALAMARVATACARTQLQRPEARHLAERFYRERVAGIFWRNYHKGTAFYRDERRWAESPFWSRRCQSAHDVAERSLASPEIATRPILRDGFVQAGRVVRTPEDPGGVWQLDGVPVVALLEAAAAPTAVLAERFAATEGQIERARAWLRASGLSVPTTPARKRAQRLTTPRPIPQSDRHG